MRRRDMLLIGGAMAGAIAVPPILRRIPSDFNFEPLPGFEGFRRLSGGTISGGVDVFAGLGEKPDQPSSDVSEPISPCLALFGSTGWGAGALPIAIFSDFNCPYCKVLERRLIDLRDSGAPIRLIWHEMPLLGAGSVRAARAVLAARFLGAEDTARNYLSAKLLRPGPVALAAMARDLDLLPALLQREYDGQPVSNALSESLALGRRLGIPGTPGTVVGRTLVIGAIKDADLRKLIKIERNEPQTVCT